jgi:hypothetical protein
VSEAFRIDPQFGQLIKETVKVFTKRDIGEFKDLMTHWGNFNNEFLIKRHFYMVLNAFGSNVGLVPVGFPYHVNKSIQGQLDGNQFNILYGKSTINTSQFPATMAVDQTSALDGNILVDEDMLEKLTQHLLTEINQKNPIYMKIFDGMNAQSIKIFLEKDILRHELAH